MSIVLLVFVLSCASADIFSPELERRVESLVNEQVAKLLLPYESANQRITALEDEVKELRQQNILLKTKNIALMEMVETLQTDVDYLNTRDRDFFGNDNSQGSQTDKSKSNMNSSKTRINVTESSDQFVPSSQYTAEPQNLIRRQSKAMINFRNRRGGSNYPGFMAQLSTNVPVVSGRTIIFGTVVANYGSHYNSHSGVFTAPLEGLYAFFVTIQVQTSHYIDILIVKNGNTISRGQGSGTERRYGTGTTVSVTHLVPGDQVWAQFTIHSSGAILDEGESNFAGFLI